MYLTRESLKYPIPAPILLFLLTPPPPPLFFPRKNNLPTFRNESRCRMKYDDRAISMKRDIYIYKNDSKFWGANLVTR